MVDRIVAQRMNSGPAAIMKTDGVGIVFCGTSSPISSAKRANACTAVVAGGEVFIVDIGSGSWETLMRGGIPGGRLKGIFVTHFHSDHLGDLGEANLYSWTGGRQTPLAVYGPDGVEQIVDGYNAAYALDNEYRVEHHGKAVVPPRAQGLSANSFAGDDSTVVYADGGTKITAFPVSHEPVAPAVGYRFDYKGRSVVISGDTAYSKSLIEASDGADVLVHEAQADHIVQKMQAGAAQAGQATTAKILEDIQTYHTTPVEAARAANEAGVDMLALTHLTPPPDNPMMKKIFLRGVSAVRSDGVVLAEDGMLMELPVGGGIEISKL